MNMKSKWILICMLCTSLLLGFSVSAESLQNGEAVESEIENVVFLREEYGLQHIHSWSNTPISSYIVVGGGLYVNAATCKPKWRNTYRCKSCTQTTTIIENSTNAHPHDHSNIWHADCNGIEQTHYKRCVSCYYNNGTYTTMRCPRAPHSGVCSFLPAGFKDEPLFD